MKNNNIFKTMNKRVYSFLLLAFATALNSFAQTADTSQVTASTEKLLNSVKDLLTQSSLLQAVLTVLIIIAGLILILNKDNETIKKRAIQVLIALAIISSASSLAGLLYSK